MRTGLILLGQIKNFGQNFIEDKHLKGSGSAEVQLQSFWDPGFVLNSKKLNVKSHLTIEKGELIDFEPLQNLSSYVSVEDLRDVKFSTLENTIEIDNSIIYIPAMEIKSSALSVYLSGTHTFNKKIDYQIKLLLSEILSNKFRKENTDIEKTYGEIEKNEEGFSTIYLKMTGNTENPEISFDRIRIREKLKESIANEKEEVTRIIKQEVLQKDSSYIKEKRKKPILEWEDNPD